jgi:hypothetical protein
MKRAVQIFLCHASEDKNTALDIYEHLRQEGFKPWLDKKDLLPGQFWREEIPKAIKASDFVLVFLSKVSVSKKGFVQKEFKLALEVLDEMPESRIFVIPVRIDNCEIPDKFSNLQWCNLFEKDGLEKMIEAIHESMKQMRIIKPITLRSKPISTLEEYYVRQMIKEYDFPELHKNRFGEGLQHQYELIERKGEKLIIDHTTGLMWQQSGSDDSIPVEGTRSNDENWKPIFEVQEHIQILNKELFGGFDDWRLPTLEEAMSLLEPKENEYGLYIYQAFDQKQLWIWTTDENSAGRPWNVSFQYCKFELIDFRFSHSYPYVRVVRKSL